MEEHLMHALLKILFVFAWSDPVAVAQSVEQTKFRLVSTHMTLNWLIRLNLIESLSVCLASLAGSSSIPNTLHSRTLTFVFVNRSLMFSRLTVRHGNVFFGVKTATTELVRWEDGREQTPHTQTTNLTTAHTLSTYAKFRAQRKWNSSAWMLLKCLSIKVNLILFYGFTHNNICAMCFAIIFPFCHTTAARLHIDLSH